jgi:hypothetical protein
MDRELAILNELVAAAEAAGLTIECKDMNTGHYHILGGAWLVNYYPFSAKRTAYAKGTTKGKPCTPAEAVQLALGPPPIVPQHERAQRSRNTREIRRRMIGRQSAVLCYWCGCELTLDTSTLDHIVPLARGGLDAPNNRVLACEPCNLTRGHAMPELQQLASANSPPWEDDDDPDPPPGPA